MAGLRHDPRRRAALARAVQRTVLLVASMSALAVAGSRVPARAAATTPAPQAVQLTLPSNASSGADAYLYGVDCVATGSCTAGGQYFDNSGNHQPMVVTESRGHWARALELRLPPNAEVNPFAEVNAIDCASQGDCVAVGYYNADTLFQGFAATESGGHWHRALLLAPPPNSAHPSDFQLNGVACTGVGSCVAVGNYRDSSGRFEALAATESGGHWARARELRLPSNAAADPGAFFVSVACWQTGSCVAAGDYADSRGVGQVVVVTESGGRWRQGTQITLPSDAAASLLAGVAAIACARAGSCAAVGSYTATGAKVRAFAVTGSPRGWRHAITLTVLPPNAASTAHPTVESVACTRQGTCVASGEYVRNPGGIAAMAAYESGGTWRRAVEVKLPRNAMTGAFLNAPLRAVSCTATGYCVAVGNYANHSDAFVPMAVRLPAP